jgi:hypothetical protein
MRITILLLVVFSLPISAQSRNERKEAKQQKKIEAFNEVKAIIDSASYVFTAQKAYPQGGKYVDLTTRRNRLIIRKDTATADLSYFGRAYNIAYAVNNGGIKFDGKMNNYSLSENSKKLALIVKFNVSTSNDSFDCTMEVFSRSSANLSVISQNRSHISYDGSIDSYKK